MTVEILIIGKGGSRSIIFIKCFPLTPFLQYPWTSHSVSDEIMMSHLLNAADTDLTT